MYVDRLIQFTQQWVGSFELCGRTSLAPSKNIFRILIIVLTQAMHNMEQFSFAVLNLQ